MGKRAGKEQRMDANPAPYALGSEDGEALWFFGMLVTMKATAEQTGGEFLLIEELAPRGTATPLHVHPTDDESFWILEGECTFYFEDGQPIPASAGSSQSSRRSEGATSRASASFRMVRP